MFASTLAEGCGILNAGCRTGGRFLQRERKVRSPESGVPANGRGLRKRGYGKRNRKDTARGKIRVRVKWCGKSAPRWKRFHRQGKPHAEQGQIGEEGLLAPLDFRVGRMSRPVMGGQEE